MQTIVYFMIAIILNLRNMLRVLDSLQHMVLLLIFLNFAQDGVLLELISLLDIEMSIPLLKFYLLGKC